jgi:hypothetical protein
MYHRLAGCFILCGLALIGIVTSAVAADERTEAERRAARELDPDVVKGLKRSDFLRQVPKAKLETYERATGFRAYALTERLAPIQIRRWYFLDDDLAMITLHVVPGRQLPNDKTNELMRKLGPPDSDDIAPADLRNGRILHSQWLFEDEGRDLAIHYKVDSDRQLGYVYVVEVANLTVLDKFEARKKKK